MALKDWPGALRKAKSLGFFPYEISELNGFPGNTLDRPMPNRLNEFYWHHDGSPIGTSPGALNWIINSYNSKSPSAQIWASYYGGWNFVGGGYASHAGITDGVSSSADSVGIETDHTTDEEISPALLDSLLRGFAVICVFENRTPSFIVYHKYRGFPYGRKPDPWFPGDDVRGTQSLSRNRAKISQHILAYEKILSGTSTPPPPPTVKDTDMICLTKDVQTGWLYGLGPGFFQNISEQNANGVNELGTGHDLGLWDKNKILVLNWVQIMDMAKICGAVERDGVYVPGPDGKPTFR